MSQEATGPKCPSCGARGIDHVAMADSKEFTGRHAYFHIVHCRDCGHVYTVFPNPLLGGGAETTGGK